MRSSIVAALATLAVILPGCGGSGSTAPPPTEADSPTSPTSPAATATATRPAPAPTVTPTATLTRDPVPPPAPAYPRGTRTGFTVIDRVVDAVERDDRAALAALIGAQEFPCEAARPVQPQPLVCRDGMSPGDILRGVLVTHVEGGLWFDPPDVIGGRLLTSLIARDAGLHAIYDCRKGGCEYSPPYRAPDYLVVFAVWGPQVGPEFDNFAIRDGKIVGYHFAFPEPPPAAWRDPRDPGWLLARAR